MASNYRRYLFDLSDSIKSPEEATQFYVAVCAWGAGLQGGLVSRRVRVLQENKDVGDRLLAGLKLARQSPVAAYQAFRVDGDNRLLHLGPAFFSKMIYFAGYAVSPTPQPLILDRYVASALNDVADLGWRSTWNWTPGQYEQYLQLATGWASDWRWEADVVERTLFEHGRRLG